MLVILIVSLLSTAAMLGYPLLARWAVFDADATALLLGAAIHDVAQVAGAGFAVSEDVGVRAVTVKMIRVACLLPVILALAILFLPRDQAGEGRARRWRAIRPPTFLVLFFLFAVITSITFCERMAAISSCRYPGGTWFMRACSTQRIDSIVAFVSSSLTNPRSPGNGASLISSRAR